MRKKKGRERRRDGGVHFFRFFAESLFEFLISCRQAGLSRLRRTRRKYYFKLPRSRIESLNFCLDVFERIFNDDKPTSINFFPIAGVRTPSYFFFFSSLPPPSRVNVSCRAIEVSTLYARTTWCRARLQKPRCTRRDVLGAARGGAGSSHARRSYASARISTRRSR